MCVRAPGVVSSEIGVRVLGWAPACVRACVRARALVRGVRGSTATRPNASLRLANEWIRRLTKKPVGFSIQFHADQDLPELRTFSGAALAVEPGEIRAQRKPNSAQLKRRPWRSRHGVLSVTANDTYLTARLRSAQNGPCTEAKLAATGRSSVWSERPLWVREVIAGSNPAAPMRPSLTPAPSRARYRRMARR